MTVAPNYEPNAIELLNVIQTGRDSPLVRVVNSTS